MSIEITAVFAKEIGLNVNRAGSAPAGSTKEASSVLIAIRANGEIWVDDRIVDVRAVRANVERMAAIKPGSGVLIVADKEAEAGNLPPEQLGAKLYEKKGCNACHTVDGSARVGPSFKGAFGTTVTLADGSKVPMDETYIRESLMSPQAKSRPGFPPSMPSFEGQLKDLEIAGLIAYIKSLAKGGGEAASEP